MSLRYGSLCSGYGGLDLAVETVTGAACAWQAEIDPDASKVLAYRFPAVTNLGDLTVVDWARVEPVDLVCFGFPCQDLSSAGKRAGIKEGTRSGLWFDCLRAVRMVRPRLVVVENVAALLSGGRGADFNIVLSGLAESGYDVRWTCLRASDIGAPHRRERVFISACHARSPFPHPHATPSRSRHPTGEPGCRTPADPLSNTRRLQPVPVAEGGGTATVADARPLPAADTAAARRRRQRRIHQQIRTGSAERSRPEPRRHGRSADRWGRYSEAVKRWEHILGRPAPPPADQLGRLNPVFVEWMMGLPAGWVTDLMRPADSRLKLSRNQALRILGNGVVPQQAEAALRFLEAL